jgi:hypothetical protein
MRATTPIRPAFHHVNLKTTRLQELIDWYATVVGTDVRGRSLAETRAVRALQGGSNAERQSC